MPDPVRWGPDNPHPLSQMKTELVWEGKYDEYGLRRKVDVAGASFPMQKIETVDMPRSSAHWLTMMAWPPREDAREGYRGAVPTKLLDMEVFQTSTQRVLEKRDERGETVGWTMESDDGVILNQDHLREPMPSWKELEEGKYDWSRTAMRYRPDRVGEKCKMNKSFANSALSDRCERRRIK